MKEFSASAFVVEAKTLLPSLVLFYLSTTAAVQPPGFIPP